MLWAKDEEPVKKKRKKSETKATMPDGPPEVVKIYEKKELKKMSKKNKLLGYNT